MQRTQDTSDPGFADMQPILPFQSDSEARGFYSVESCW